MKTVLRLEVGRISHAATLNLSLGFEVASHSASLSSESSPGGFSAGHPEIPVLLVKRWEGGA